METEAKATGRRVVEVDGRKKGAPDEVDGAPKREENGRELEVPVTVVEGERGAGRKAVDATEIETRKDTEEAIEEGDGGFEEKRGKSVDENDGRDDRG